MHPEIDRDRATRTTGRSLLRMLAALGIVAAGLAPTKAAGQAVTVENVRVGFDGHYKVGAWTPVSIDLKAGRQPFVGAMEVIVPDDDGTATAVARQVNIPAGQTLAFPAYVRPGARDTEFQVRVVDERGRTAARGVGQQTYFQIDPEQRLVLTLGSPRGVDEIVKLPGFADPDGPSAAPVIILPARVDALPAAWFGLDAADTIVLDTNARDVMSSLDALRGEGLRQWVQNGGHLVLAVGANWQVVNDSFLRPMLPATPTGREAMTDLGAVESFVGSVDKPFNKPDEPVQVTRFELVPDRGPRPLDSTASGPVLVRGHYGFGRVTVVGLDVDGKTFADWPLKNSFWAKVMDVKPRAESATAGGNAQNAAIMQNRVSDLATLLHSNLEQFEGVKLVPFGWVAFFVFLYILLIGPGDYFFLKKVVKRMELTWITFPLIVGLVSALAYAAAYAVKGTDLRVNKVDALDIDQADNLMRGTTWATVFSPRNRDYDIALTPLDPTREPSAGDKTGGDDSAARAIPATGRLLSWFGSPEAAFGGMGGSGRMSLSGASYAYASENNPFGPPERMRGVRIPIWSTKSLSGQWFAPAVKAVEADLQADGADRVSGTVTNALAVPLRDAYLIGGKYAYKLGDLAPGQTKSLAEASDRTLAGYVGELVKQLPKVQRWELMNRAVDLQRGDLVRALMFGSVTRGQAEAIDSEALRSLDLSGQVALERPMLVANLGGEPTPRSQAQPGQAVAKPAAPRSGADAPPFPAVELDLGRAGAGAKLEQTTVLRVILPAPKGR